jgi:hypothetical protein
MYTSIFTECLEMIIQSHYYQLISELQLYITRNVNYVRILNNSIMVLIVHIMNFIVHPSYQRTHSTQSAG